MGIDLLAVMNASRKTSLTAGEVAVMYGFYGQYAPIAGLSAVPIALWEFSLGIYLVVTGFKSVNKSNM